MKKQIILSVVSLLMFLLFASVCMAENISVSGSIVGYKYNTKGCWPTTILAEGTFTFDPDKIVKNPTDTEEKCRPVSISSPVFGGNKEIQLRIAALKCGSSSHYYSFKAKYYNLEISFIISHEKLEKIKKFRIQLNHPEEDEGNELKTPKGKQTEIYFEGKLLEK